jgi:FAD dependent oxidoreductase TIGR03364
MNSRFDDIVVGAGIIGLAHAYHLAKRRRHVLVLERSRRAAGASVRNFGMLWPIGQPAGGMHELALRSLDIWLALLRAAGLGHERGGSLHLAYHEDEAQVLDEFATAAPANGFDCKLLDAGQVRERSPFVRLEGLRVALWSPTETCVDPREVIAGIPAYLTREYGVQFQYGVAAVTYERPRLLAGGREWFADRLWVCAGDDLETLYPEAFRESSLVRCKLQMLRSRAVDGPRMGPMLAAGLTLRHYKSFADCPSLPALAERYSREMPLYDRFGIHVMTSQNGSGEIVIGDSHEYDEAIEPFDKEHIEKLILAYLGTFLDVPGLQIAARWHGTYAKHPTQPYWIARPESGVTIVTGLGGAGMTLSFGLAEKVVSESLGEG